MPESTTTAPPPAAAPSTPAPAPGAAPLKPTPPAQVSPPAPKKAPPSSDPYAEIDAMAKEEPKKPAAKKEGKESPPPQKSDAASQDATSAEKKPTGPSSESNSTETGQENQSASTASSQTPLKAPELRAAYEALKKKHAALEAEHSKAKAAPVEDPEKPRLVSELTAAQKRLEALETEIKYANYERSQEYQDTYEKPFVAAYQAGRQKASSLAVTQDDGTTRKGTPADFDAIMSISDDAKASQLASEMFGTGAGMVLYHRERVQEFNRARQDAVEEFRKSGADREKSRSAQMEEMRQRRQQSMAKLGETFKARTAADIEQYPTFFKPEDGDEEGNRLLEKGMEWADKAFAIPPGTPPEEMVAIHAAMRNKAGAFDRMVYRAKKDKARIAELEKELEQFKASDPGADGGRHEDKPKAKSWEEEIDAMASR